jgi:galactokinase
VSAGRLAQLSPANRRHAEQALARASEALKATSGVEPSGRLWVPGRIEVLGKHTDYAGGRSLTCAVERGFAVAFTPRSTAEVRIIDAHDRRHAQFALADNLTPPVGEWINYPMTVARRLARNFPGLATGADIAFYSNLPRAAGLSTSSALITAVYLALTSVNDLPGRPAFQQALPSDVSVAGYLGSIENGQAFGTLAGDSGVGTFGGSEDHTAILLSLAGVLGSYHYRPVTRLRQIALDPDLIFVVASSGIVADKTGGAREDYNRASNLVRALLALWQQATGRNDTTLADALASAPDAAEQMRELASSNAQGDFSPVQLRNRLEHFITEDGQVIPAALEALAAGDLNQFGRLVDRSQEASETLLGNQVPETIMLARLAREHGALAASAFGAGFGGSVWALTHFEEAEAFGHAWKVAYAKAHPGPARHSTFFMTRPGPGAGAA